MFHLTFTGFISFQKGVACIEEKAAGKRHNANLPYAEISPVARESDGNLKPSSDNSNGRGTTHADSLACARSSKPGCVSDKERQQLLEELQAYEREQLKVDNQLRTQKFIDKMWQSLE